MQRTFFILFLLILSIHPSTLGQNSPAAVENDSPLKAAVVTLPKGDNAWVARIIQTGGIKGGLLLDITATSGGKLTCFPSEKNCGKVLSGNPLQGLTLLASKPLGKIESKLSDACKDCIVTRITLQRREANGKTPTYFAYWDDTSAANTSPELVSIAQTVIALSKL